MEEKDGGQAFPCSAGVRGYGRCVTRQLPNGETGWEDIEPGMTLRDYFAAKVMHAEILSDGSFQHAAEALAEAAQKAGQTLEERIAFLSYRMADEMLKARCREA